MAGNGDDGTPPTTPKAGGTGYGSLTAREGEIMAKAMVCLKTAPEVCLFLYLFLQAFPLPPPADDQRD